MAFDWLFNTISSPSCPIEMGSFIHEAEGELVCSSTNPQKIPYFNAGIYLQNKTQIGKVDEILGPINEVYFTVKLQEGMVASSFKAQDKVYIAGDKLLPIERFLPKPKAPAGSKVESECFSLEFLMTVQAIFLWQASGGVFLLKSLNVSTISLSS